MYHPEDPLGLSKSVEGEAAKVRRGWDKKTRRHRLGLKKIPDSYEFPRYRIIYDPKDPEVMIGLEPM